MELLTHHPASAIMPDCSPDEYAELVASIDAVGLLEPIVLLDGQILDGRHRYRACIETGREPRFEQFEALGYDGSEADYVLDKHKRRNLTIEQKSTIAVARKKYLQEHVISPGNPSITQNSAGLGEARKAAADAVGISHTTVGNAEKVADTAPDVFDRMKRGEYGSVERAKRVAELPPEDRERVHELMDSGVAAKDAEREWFGRDEYSTPEWVLDMARDVLGNIDLDPATNNAAQKVVQAGTAYTAKEDGLKQEWFGRVWLNPPYSQPLCSQFTERLVTEYAEGNVSAAIVLVNTASETNWWQHLAKHCTCLAFPSSRIQFYHPATKASDSNRYAQTVFYFGPDVGSFADATRALGWLPAEVLP